MIRSAARQNVQTADDMLRKPVRHERHGQTQGMSAKGLLFLLLVGSACGGHAPAHTAPDESRPHISWEIRSGGDFGDAQFVCGSAKPTSTCTLTASSGERRTLVTLHLYLHPAAAQTNYVGAWRAPFLQGWTTKDYREVSGTVRPGDDPYAVSVSGIVTDKPGKYSFNVLLDAAQEGVPDGTRITLDIPVVVTSAERDRLA